MNFRILSLTAILSPLSLQAQIPQAVPAGVPGSVTITTTTPAAQPLDSVIIRRQLSTAPRVIVTTPSVPAVPAPQPSIEKTIKTTTVVETDGQPVRVYNTERHVVVVQEQNQSRELPYVTLPVLFVKETAELLDNESRAALDQMAGVINEVVKTEPTATFDIEGHTSTDGTDEFNQSLSTARAQRIYDELTQRYAVPSAALTGRGYGERFPKYPSGTEEEMQQDRRVLVVRSK